MAGLMKGLSAVRQLKQRVPSVLYMATRNHWNKDYKPAPFPKTEEERLAAAKKYNLLPEEYKPYADTGMGYGDYPHLPDVSVERRDPYYPYDNPDMKRNFNEPIHADIDLIGEDRYGTPEDLAIPIGTQVCVFLAVMVGFFAIYYALDEAKLFRPVAAKQYPGDGRKHYTFETTH